MPPKAQAVVTVPEESITANDLQRQIKSLGERMDHGFGELKDLFRKSDERLRGLETREASCQPIVTARIDAAWREIDTHKEQIKELQVADDGQDQAITQLREQNRLLLWLAGLEGSAILVWVITSLLKLI